MNMDKKLVVVRDRLPGHEKGKGRQYLVSPRSAALPMEWVENEALATKLLYRDALRLRDLWRSGSDPDDECITIQPPGAKLHECLLWSDGSSTLGGPLTDDMRARGLVEPDAVIEQRFMATCVDQWFTLASALRGHGIRTSMLDENGQIDGLEPLDEIIANHGGS